MHRKLGPETRGPLIVPPAAHQVLPFCAVALHTMANSTSSKSQTPTMPPPFKAPEVDFYTNPTVLSRLILHQKYESALRRLKRAPREALTWVSTHRQDGDVTTVSYRQLPLHMACTALSRTVDTTLRSQVLDLINRLVVAYPEACAARDHDERLPLHEALVYGVNPDTVVTLLMAYPTAVHETDRFGRTPLQLHQQHCQPENKEEITAMLQRGTGFWNFCRNEAKLQAKQRKPTTTTTTNDDVQSIGVLNDSLADRDDYTLQTRASVASVLRSTRPTRLVQKPLTPTAWSQLEQRAVQLEQLLQSKQESNYQMTQELERLRSIEEKYQQITSSKYLAKSLLQLEEEKSDMTNQIAKLKRALRKHGIDADDLSTVAGTAAVDPRPLEICVGDTISLSSNHSSFRKNLESTSSSSKKSSSSSSNMPVDEQIVLDLQLLLKPNNSGGKKSKDTEGGSSVPSLVATSSLKQEEEEEAQPEVLPQKEKEEPKVQPNDEKPVASTRAEITLPPANTDRWANGSPLRHIPSIRPVRRPPPSMPSGERSSQEGDDDDNLSTLSRARLIQERQAVDQLRQERQYLQSLIAHLGSKRTTTKTRRLAATTTKRYETVQQQQPSSLGQHLAPILEDGNSDCSSSSSSASASSSVGNKAPPPTPAKNKKKKNFLRGRNLRKRLGRIHL